MIKRWKIKFKAKSLKLKTEEIIKILLKNRGLVSKKEIDNFLQPLLPWSRELIEDLQINQKQLALAVKRIKKAIKQKEAIVVYGDYDADGICAIAILWETLYALGAKVMPFIPSREEHGYGLSKKGIDEIINNLTMKQFNNETIKLIITVDNGIVAHKAVEFAKEKGIEVIITDHHQRKLKAKSLKLKANKYDLPKAEAIVWSDKVSGAGVAWAVAEEILKRSDLAATQGRTLYKNNLDLLAIGTIADMMPLIGINRSIVKHGLDELNQTKRLGLVALMEEAGLKKGLIESWHVGFIIAPRLNAMGRLTTAWDSLRLLCTKNKERARKLATKLGTTNRERQTLTFNTFLHAQESILQGQSLQNAQGLSFNKKIIFIAHESYNQGVIGLVAGKLVEEFYRPAIVISKGEIYSKASVRSVNGFNIIEYLRQFEDIYEDLGGHPMAAGFTIRTGKLTLLEKRLTETAPQVIDDQLLTPSLEADCEINLNDIDQLLYQELKRFSPFGIGNPQPSFVSRGIEIVSFQQVGGEGKHLKLRLQIVKRSDLAATQGLSLKVMDAIAFNHGDLAFKLSPGQKIDILYTIEEDTWNGNNKLQLKIKDIKLPKNA